MFSNPVAFKKYVVDHVHSKIAEITLTPNNNNHSDYSDKNNVIFILIFKIINILFIQRGHRPFIYLNVLHQQN